MSTFGSDKGWYSVEPDPRILFLRDATECIEAGMPGSPAAVEMRRVLSLLEAADAALLEGDVIALASALSTDTENGCRFKEGPSGYIDMPATRDELKRWKP